MPERNSNDSQYSYRWSYEDQYAFEKEQMRKNKKNGVLIYAIVMTSVFLVCIALLLSVIFLTRNDTHDNNTNHATTEIGAVATEIKPSTVLINARFSGGESYGTGFFLTSDGYIVTNYHIISAATEIKVTLYSGKQLDATMIGYYAPDDLAVLKIDGSGYQAVSIGDSSELEVGDLAIAIGNPSGAEASWTTTHGIISALNRRVAVSGTGFIGEMKMIQTDAPLNPGNSGGPLCNADGEVIGIVTRKLTDYVSIGFAIPINEAMTTLNAIISGSLDSFESEISIARPAIGFSGENIAEGEQFRLGGTLYTAKSDGILVVSVVEGSAAENVLTPGDILCVFDGTSITEIKDLQKMLYDYKIGDAVEVKVWRKDKLVDLTLTLGK